MNKAKVVEELREIIDAPPLSAGVTASEAAQRLAAAKRAARRALEAVNERNGTPKPLAGISPRLLSRVEPSLLQHSDWRAALRILSHPAFDDCDRYIGPREIDWESIGRRSMDRTDRALYEIGRALFEWDWNRVRDDHWGGLDARAWETVRDAMEIRYLGRALQGQSALEYEETYAEGRRRLDAAISQLSQARFSDAAADAAQMRLEQHLDGLDR